MRYRNPWHCPRSGGPLIYDRTGCRIMRGSDGRGVIVRVYPNHHDYVIFGRVVTQRVGADLGLLQRMIAAMFDDVVDPGIDVDRLWRAFDKGEAFADA